MLCGLGRQVSLLCFSHNACHGTPKFYILHEEFPGPHTGPSMRSFKLFVNLHDPAPYRWAVPQENLKNSRKKDLTDRIFTVPDSALPVLSNQQPMMGDKDLPGSCEAKWKASSVPSKELPPLGSCRSTLRCADFLLVS